MRIPPGACDTHVHVFDRSRLPAGLTPEPTPDASARSYVAVRDKLGLERTVLVQANGYGTDNRCMLDAVQTLGPSRTRAVAIVDTDVSDEELASMHHQGVRGLRFHMLEGGRMRWNDLEPLAHGSRHLAGTSSCRWTAVICLAVRRF
jgi:D-galactarolactone isomerase